MTRSITQLALYTFLLFVITPVKVIVFLVPAFLHHPLWRAVLFCKMSHFLALDTSDFV